VRKLAMPLPFNGPSPTLFQLLGFLVDAGKGVVQTSFEKLSDQNPNAPVGTTLALIEQGMVVFSSIHSRLHNSMARVFRILHRINSAYLTEEDIDAMNAGLEIKPEDFDGPMDIIPVSDPAIFSEAQRFAQVQAVLQRSAMLPQMYDVRKVEEMFLRNLKLSPDDVLQPEPGQDDVDPVSENVAATMGRPVYVLPKQDHVAHIQTHLAFLKSPLFGMNPAMVKTYIYPMAMHLRDHLLNFYLTQSHEAVERAEKEGLITDDANQQVKVIMRVQQIIEEQMGQFAQELAQIDEMAQQFAPQPPQMPQDKSMEIAQLNAQVQGQALQQRAQVDGQRLQVEQAKLTLKQQSDQQALADKQQARAEEMQREQMRQAAENERTAASIEADLQMNSDDNATAMRLAAAEIASGEKVAVSTGSGINPGTR